MSIKQFSFRLLLYTAFAILVAFIFYRVPVLAPYHLFSLQTIVFFVFLSIFFYTLAWIASRSRNIYMFNNIIMMTSLIKLVFCFVVIFLYHKNFHPADNYFIIPFFTYYILYTVFEIDFMGKLARR